MVPVRTLKTIMNMDKYVCDVCGYIYDPAVGIPTMASNQVQHLKTCPKTGSALSAV